MSCLLLYVQVCNQKMALLPPADVVCEGYVFTPVCDSVNRGGWHVWLLRGACMVALGGCAWLLRGACMVAQGACVVVRGGMRGCSGGHAWLPGGACMVVLEGCMVARGAYMGYDEIRRHGQ